MAGLGRAEPLGVGRIFGGRKASRVNPEIHGVEGEELCREASRVGGNPGGGCHGAGEGVESSQEDSTLHREGRWVEPSQDNWTPNGRGEGVELWQDN